MDDKTVEIAMMIIMHAGTAKSLAVEAIDLADQGKFEEANKSIEEAEASYTEAAKEHFKAIQADSEDGGLNLNVLFIHAEDQMLNSETIIILAKKMIALHKKIA